MAEKVAWMRYLIGLFSSLVHMSLKENIKHMVTEHQRGRGMAQSLLAALTAVDFDWVWERRARTSLWKVSSTSGGQDYGQQWRGGRKKLMTIQLLGEII